MKKIILIIVTYLFCTGPVMAFILNTPENPDKITAPLALLIIGFGLIGLGSICRQIQTDRKRQTAPRIVMDSVNAPS